MNEPMHPDQDPVIARALADLAVPDHGAGFWEELDRRLARVALADGAGVHPLTSAPPAGPLGEMDQIDLRDAAAEVPPDQRTDTGELPTVAELHPPTPAPRRQKLWFAAAAAVLVLAAVGVAALVGSDDEPDGTTASDDTTSAVDDEATTLSTTATSSTSSTSAPSTTSARPDPAAPEAVVTRWMDAVASGDIASASALTGPRSVSYWESQGDGASLEGALQESAETYGALTDAPDLNIQEVPLSTFDFGDVTLVAVSGTFTAAGYDGGLTTFVFPVVTDDGESLVEPWAFSPGSGGSFEVTLPEATVDEGNVLAAEEAVELFVPVDGTVYFRLDDGTEGTRPVETSTVAGSPFARYDPPGALPPGDHIVLLGFVSPDGEVLLGEAVAFKVE